MFARWDQVKRILKKPFDSKRSTEQPAPDVSGFSNDRRRRFIKRQIVDLEEEVREVQQGLGWAAEMAGTEVTFDIRQRLTRARDLRYKANLLRAELSRSFPSDSKRFEKNTPDAPTAEPAPDKVAEIANQLLQTISFVNRSQKMIFQRAMTDLLSLSAYKRRAAIKIIGDLRLPECTPLIKAALVFQDDVIQIKALEALVELNAEGIIEELEKRIFSHNCRVRFAALRGLFNLHSDSIYFACLQGLADISTDIRRGAIRFLALIDEKESAPAIGVMLRDEDKEVRVTAARALGSLGAEQTVYMLIRALEDEEIAVREASKDSLVRILDRPLHIELRTEPAELSQMAAGLLRWWTEVRPRGGPWSA
jgi:HEAT repeat protein